jgi:5-formyltetrahydrofolate cyclo-ligase
MSCPPDRPEREALDRAKVTLRLNARAARRSVTPEVRTAASYAIAERLLRLPEILDATAVAVYGPSPEEADPGVLESALRDRGLRIAYPRVKDDRTLELHWVDVPDVLTLGAFGLTEPTTEAPTAALGDLSAIIVPAVALDPDGNRLGFGGGFYDVLLGGHDGHPPAIAIAYDEQLFDHVPHDERDHRVDIIVTPTRTLRCATTRS